MTKPVQLSDFGDQDINVINGKLKNILYQHLDSDWKLQYKSSTCSLGKAKYRKKIIELNKKLIETKNEQKILDIFHHELCHVLAVKNGERVGHKGRIFKAYCEKFKTSSATKADFSLQLSHQKINYILKCPICSYKWEKSRLTKQMKTGLCGRCHVKLEIIDLRKDREIKY
jgi:predicted SprT family Zn-dependent metalloprotease